MLSVSLVTHVNRTIICFLVCIAWRQWGTHAWVKHQECTPLGNQYFGCFQRPGWCVVCAWRREAWCGALLQRSVEMRENLFSISKFVSVHSLEEPTFNVSHSVQPLASTFSLWSHGSEFFFPSQRLVQLYCNKKAFYLHMMQQNKSCCFFFKFRLFCRERDIGTIYT